MICVLMNILQAMGCCDWGAHCLSVSLCVTVIGCCRPVIPPLYFDRLCLWLLEVLIWAWKTWQPLLLTPPFLLNKNLAKNNHFQGKFTNCYSWFFLMTDHCEKLRLVRVATTTILTNSKRLDELLVLNVFFVVVVWIMKLSIFQRNSYFNSIN